MVDGGWGCNYTGKARKEKKKKEEVEPKQKKERGEGLKSCGAEENKEGEE